MMRSFLSCVAFVAAAAAGSAAFGQVYSNTTVITIPNLGNAAPYPSTITVAGGPASIGNFVVALRGFSHTYPADVQVLLVAPSGQAVQLMNGNGGPFDVVNLTLGFFNNAVAPLPTPLVSGTYAASGGSFAFAAPAPAPPFLTSLGNLAGVSSNGVWRLFVTDNGNNDTGSFAGGWSIEFPEPITPIAPSTFTYQGKLTGGASSGTIDARFTVFDNLTSTSLTNRVGAVSTATGVALVDGVFTAPVNPGVLLPGDRKTWLQVEVANPSGSAYVALTPRQPITPAPLAGTALTAVSAVSAGSAVSALTLRSGTEDLRLLRGTMNGGGVRVNGSGFTSSRVSVGVYNIAYDTPFTAAAALTANVIDSGAALTVSVAVTTASGTQVLVRNSAGALTDSPFAFTVIGPR